MNSVQHQMHANILIGFAEFDLQVIQACVGVPVDIAQVIADRVRAMVGKRRRGQVSTAGMDAVKTTAQITRCRQG